ncbi:MAG: phosphomevalonate kinase [Melioribacteraceae bacterium]|nr:MAG: phosphomevalonate kinase [Melioribacteraceae bacterium]
MNNKEVEVRVPGKMFLTGEYAVLFGAPALITSVDRYAVVTISATDSGSTLASSAFNIDKIGFEIEDKKFKINEPSLHDKLIFISVSFNLFLARFPQYAKQANNIDVKIDTSQFYSESGSKLGFGSSAAVTVGFLQALSRYFRDEDFTSETLMKFASEAHSIAQNKTGSGGDIAVAAYGKSIKFRKELNGNYYITPVHIPKNFEILTIWSGVSCSTSEYIFSVMEYKNSNRQDFEVLLDDFNNSAILLADNFQENSFQNFSEQIIVYYSLLEKLGLKAGINIMSREHRKINSIVRSCEGVYKPSGAGGGDVGLAFFERDYNRNKLTGLLEESGFNLVNLRYGV